MNNFDICSQDAEELINEWNTSASKEKGGREMNDVLYHLCRHCVGTMDGWIPYPSTILCKVCNLSLYKTRKELKTLKEKGYVIADRYVEKTEEGQILINGYTITEKAKETEEFKKAFDEEKQLVKKCFNFDI